MMEMEQNVNPADPVPVQTGQNVMPDKSNVKLTAAEMSQIWGAYQNDSLVNCMLQHFLAKAEDPEIRPLIEHAVQLSQSHIRKLTDICIAENFPVPHGFKEGEDVDVTAPRLFSDTYVLNYLLQMGKLGINATSVAVALSARLDIHDYFAECLMEYTDLHRRATEILLSKGLYIRPPYIPTPKKVDFVKQQGFLTGWLGDRRPLLSSEITNLFDNVQRNALGVATMIGFSQVAKSKKVRQYMLRGKEIAAKHIEIFGSILREDDLPVPMTWDSEVTDSTDSPFSDKLMMFHTTALIAIGMGYYGTSMATSVRSDIAPHYARLTGEIAKYSVDGARLMIENGWMEQPPQAADRDKLANMKH